ncbi:MAG TPA: deoxyribonuclease IV [Longimicrobiales bacterium]
MERTKTDELGAHVSAAGGVEQAPARAAEIDAVVLQLFTKQPNRWAEREVSPATAAAFREARATHEITVAVSHDSYLINLATPDAALFEKSYHSFRAELERCVALGLEYLVTHPGNATDGDVDRGLAQNAEAIERALEEVGGATRVLLETTAGSGKVLGASFEQLARMLESIRRPLRDRVGVCLDTCHVWAAGYDLRDDYDGVFERFDAVLGFERLKLFHLNDSVGTLGSRRDRHAAIGEGTLGEEPFRRLMTDDRFRAIPKILETPKGDDMVSEDRRNLGRLRSYRA